MSVEPARRPSAAQLAKELRSITTPRRWLRVFGIFMGVLLLAAASRNVILSDSNGSNVPEFVPPKVPTTYEEFFARGLKFLELGDVNAAMNDFDVARGMNPNGKILAHIGFCLSKLGKDREAESLYAQAIEKKYASVWVHNNRAVSLMQFGQNLPGVLKRALESAQLARDVGPRVRQIRLNWVLARFLVAGEGKPKGFNDPEAVAELKAALAEGPVDTDLCINAAWVLSASGPENHHEAISLLRQAISLGRLPKAILLDPFLRFHLANHPDYLALEKLIPGPKSTLIKDLRLMFPIQ